MYLEYYIGRTGTPVVDEDGNQIHRARTVFIDFLIDPKMKLLLEKVKGNMSREEKEAIEKNNAKKSTEREKKQWV